MAAEPFRQVTKWFLVAPEPARLLSGSLSGDNRHSGTQITEITSLVADGSGPVDAVGVGAFGPLDLDRSSPTWGSLTTTQKPGWANTDLVAAFETGLGVPVALDTDVNAAALGEL